LESVRRDRLDAIVIGAGMAGVTAGRALAQAGLRVLLLEGRRRIGGRIHTLRDFCDAPVEAGAEFIHGRAAKTWPDVQAAHLAVRPSPHKRQVMMNIGDGARWLPAALANPQAWPAFTILGSITRAASERDDLSAAEFIARQGYRGRARTLAEMVLGAHPPGDLSDIGIRGFVADGVLRLENGSDYRIDAGYDQLVEHIASGLTIEYGFVVSSIQWSTTSVAIESKDGRSVRASAAVLTVPAGVLQAGSIHFSPMIPESKRLALEGITTGPVFKMLLLFEEPFWPKGLSALFCGVGPATLYWNVFYPSNTAPPVLCAYATGPRATALSRVSEEDALTQILEDLRSNFQTEVPWPTTWRCVDWSKDPFACGGYSFVRPGAAAARVKLAAPTTGMLFWAGSETATVPIAATVEGAFTSGLRAAEELLQAIGE
jgi:monoamine oxidase